MNYRFKNPTGSSFSQAFELQRHERLVFVSGQVPAEENDKVPTEFGDQCELVWKNIEPAPKSHFPATKTRSHKVFTKICLYE